MLRVLKKDTSILCILVLTTFIVLYRHFLFGQFTIVYRDWGYDTFHQYLPAYDFFANQLRMNTLSVYSFSYGLGTSIFTPLSWVADPISLLPVFWGSLFGIEKIGPVLVYAQILKSLLAGLLCLYFLKQKGFTSFACIVSSYIYSFSGYMIATGQHYWFAIFPAYFILLLIFVDKALVHPKHAISLALVTSLISIRSPYNSYMMLLAAVFYSIFQVYFVHKKISLAIKSLTRLAFSMLVGLMISMISFLPQAMEIMTLSSRLDQGSIVDRALNSFHLLPVEYIKTAVLRMFSNNLQGTVNTWQGASLHFSAFPYFFSSLFILLATQFVIHSFRKNCVPKARYSRLIIFIILIVGLANAFTPQLFNMFAGIEFRYLFVVLPLFAFVVAETIDKIRLEHSFNRLLNFITINVSSIIILSLCLPLSKSDPDISSTIYVTLGTLLIGGILLDQLYVFSLPKSPNGTMQKKVVTALSLALFACIIMNLLFENNIILYHNRNIIQRSQLLVENQAADYRSAVDSTVQKEGDNFYRVEATSLLQNSPDALYSLIVPSRTVSFYNSIENTNVLNYVKMMYGNTTINQCIYRLGSYGSIMDVVTASNLGIKYVLSDIKHQSADWDFVGQYAGQFLYRNKMLDSAGLLFDTYMYSNESENLSQADRQLGMTQTVVIDSLPGDFTNDLKHISTISFEKDQSAIDFSSIDASGVTLSSMEGMAYHGQCISDASIIEIPLNLDLTNVGKQQHQLSFVVNTVQSATVALSYRDTSGDMVTISNSINPNQTAPNQDSVISTMIPSDAKSIIVHITKTDFMIKDLSIRNAVVSYQNEAVHLYNPGMKGMINGTVSAQRSSILLIPVPFESSWTAKIDGQPIPLLKANFGFLGMPVRPGDHKIELIYHNKYLSYGIYLTILGTLILIIWSVYLLQPKKRLQANTHNNSTDNHSNPD